MRTVDDFTRPLEYIPPMDRYMGEITRKWAEREVFPVRRKFDEDWEEHHFIEPAFKSLLGEMGFQRFFFPEDLGGFGMGHSNYAATGAYRICEEVSRGDSAMGVAFAVLHWPFLMICLEPHVNRRLCEEENQSGFAIEVLL